MIFDKGCVDIIFLGLNSLDDVFNLIFHSDILTLSTIGQSAASFVKGVESSRRGHAFNVITSRVKDLNFAKSGSKRNVLLGREIVVLDIGLHELLGLDADLVEISKVLLAVWISLWETNLSLDFRWDEWQTLSSIVLNFTWSRNMQVVSNIMSTAFKHSIEN